MTPYDQMGNRALDAAIAERVMGWKVNRKHPRIWMKQDGMPYGGFAWNPSEDDNAARLVRDRIAELGLVREYRQGLATKAERESGGKVEGNSNRRGRA